MIDSLHSRIQSSVHFRRLTAVTRVLLAIGFLEPGLRKIFGLPFTVLPTSNPVGYFFDAFFQAEAFYAFVGWGQVIAAVLLLFPRTATLGAVIFFPIIANITVITISIGFRGTWMITGLMTLGCIYLLIWDYDRLKSLLPVQLRGTSISSNRELKYQALFWAIAGMTAYGLGGIVNLANLWSRMGFTGFMVAAAAGVFLGTIVGWHMKLMKTNHNLMRTVTLNESRN